MLFTKAVSLRALSRASCQATGPAARRHYATEYDQRTKETLKTSSRLTWLTTAAAIGAAALYYSTTATTSTASTSTSTSSTSQASTPSANPPNPPNTPEPGHRHESAYASDVPKPVEDRHGDSVTKHSIAAHKNQNKVREGKFSGKEFDNHKLTHSPGKPGGDFEEKR